MTQIDLSMSKFEKFGQELQQLTRNLANTAGVFEEIVVPVANESGSELLKGVADDVVQIKEEFMNKSKTSSRLLEGLEEYTKSLKRINSL